MSADDTRPIYPPKEVFLDEGSKLSTDSLSGAERSVPVAIGVEFPEEGGILLHFENHKYPKQGWPFKQAIRCVDMVKRFILSFIRLFYSLPKAMVTGNTINLFIEIFGEYSAAAIEGQGVIFKPQFYCTMARELYRVGKIFVGDYEGVLEKQKREEPMSDDDIKIIERHRLLEAVCFVFENDDAYRYFIQDLFGELDVDAFIKSPSKEVRRLLDIAIIRSEPMGSFMKSKIKKIGIIASLILYIPCIKRFFREFIKKVDIEKLYLDERDQYQVLAWNGWNFGGRDLRYRLIIRENIDDEWHKSGSKHFDTKNNEIAITTPPKQKELTLKDYLEERKNILKDLKKIDELIKLKRKK